MNKFLLILLTIFNVSALAETLPNSSVRSDDSTAKPNEITQPGSTSYIPLKPQAWQLRRSEFTKAVNASLRDPSDAKSHQLIDQALTEFEHYPDARTPMEIMDMLGAFYLPKDGIQKTMPFIIMQATLGWHDALQWASKSGMSEIYTNEGFFSRAFHVGKTDFWKEWEAIIKNDPKLAEKIVVDGFKYASVVLSTHAKTNRGYDHKWPTAYGIERILPAMSGQPERTISAPNLDPAEAYKAAKDVVLTYYLLGPLRNNQLQIQKIPVSN